MGTIILNLRLLLVAFTDASHYALMHLHSQSVEWSLGGQNVPCLVLLSCLTPLDVFFGLQLIVCRQLCEGLLGMSKSIKLPGLMTVGPQASSSSAHFRQSLSPFDSQSQRWQTQLPLLKLLIHRPLLIRLLRQWTSTIRSQVVVRC
jgi:hypothetical protein